MYGNVGSDLPLPGTENQELFKFPYSMQYMVLEGPKMDIIHQSFSLQQLLSVNIHPLTLKNKTWIRY